MLVSSSQRQFRFADSPAPGIPGNPSSCYLGKNCLLARTVHNLNLLCNSSDLIMTPPLALTGQWEADITNLLFRCLRPGMKFLDIGANIGYFTVLGASIVTNSGRVDAFEPDPVAFQLLEHNARINGVTHHTRMRKAALADTTGKRTFYSFAKNFAAETLAELSAELSAEHGEQPAEMPVDCLSLDDAYAHDAVIFDVIRMNAEGSEALLFKGATNFFRRNIHDGTVITLHFNPAAVGRAGRSPAELLSNIRSHGFRIFQRIAPQEVKEIRSHSMPDMWNGTELLVSRSPFRWR